MLGPVFLVAYTLLSAVAAILPPARRDRLKAQSALTFSALSDGELDDDFAERFFQIVRARPDLLDGIGARVRGAGWITQRQRLTVDMARALLTSGQASTFG